MGRHTQQSDHKVAHTILLTLSILSVGSPVGLIMAVSEQKDVAEAEPTIDSLDTSWLALPQGSPTLNLSVPIEKARQETVRRVTKKPRPPTATKTKVKVKTKAEAETSPKPKTPTSRLVPTVTSRTTTRPSVAQRQIAKANTTTNPRPPTIPPRRSTSTSTSTTSHRPTSTTTQKPTTTTTTSPRTTTTTTTTKEPPPPSSSVGERVVAVAKTYVGDNLPYRMGGDSLTTGIDCSHFVWRVFKEAGLNVPYRSSSALAVWTTRVTTPQIGDLVLYSGHVGIYAGNGMMVHHGKPGGAFFIKVYKDNFIGYGRIPA